MASSIPIGVVSPLIGQLVFAARYIRVMASRCSGYHAPEQILHKAGFEKSALSNFVTIQVRLLVPCGWSEIASKATSEASKAY